MPNLKDLASHYKDRSPKYFEGDEDAALITLLAEAEENCRLRDRKKTAEKLKAQGKVVSEAAIDAYQLSDEEMAERLEAHQAYYNDLMQKLVS